MKKIIFSFLCLTIIFSGNSLAATTPTPTVSNALLEKVANEIASRTAQLNLVEKRGILGTVTDSSGTQITLSDTKGNTRFVDVDELTKFSSASSKSFGISDVEKGDYLGVLGLYNKQSRRILARDISVESSFPSVIYGAIAQIDKENFEITVVKQNKQRVVIGVEDITKTYAFSKDGLVKSGFSKTVVGETIIAIGFPDKQDPNKILATRMLLFPNVQTNISIEIEPSANPTTPPSTGSGVKLYQVTK